MRALFMTELGRFRIVSLLEGVSYILLVGIAVPLKYLAGDPSLVKILGRVHGGLFVLFLFVLARAAMGIPWGWRRVAVAFVASIVPFGAFWLERTLRREEAEQKV
jgi:integral membrane protein